MTANLRMILVTLPILATTSAARAEPQLEVMPGLGLGKATGEDSDEIELGPGLFVAVGARMHPRASLRGQLSVDRPGIDDGGSGIDVSFWMFRAEVVPAFHFGNEKVDVGVGPALGLFYMRASAEVSSPLGNAEASVSARGFTLGVQTWLMARVSPEVSLGPVFSYGRLWATKACFEEANLPETCDDSPDNDDQGYLNLSLGLLF